MNMKAFLNRVADILEVGWCRGTGAMDAAGMKVHVADDSACRWCLTGAVDKAGCELIHASGTDQCLRNKAVKVIADVIYERDGPRYWPNPLTDCWRWNDRPERTQAEVVSLVRETAGEML